jgi:hypothetical protein
MNRHIAVPVVLLIAVALFVGEALLVVLLPPFRGWEPGVAVFSALVAWGLIRRSRIAWGIAVSGGVAQLGVGAAEESSWVILAGAGLLVCLLSSPVRGYVFDKSTSRAPLTSPNAEASLAHRLSASPMQWSLQLEDLAVKVDRRWVIRGVITVVCLFFVVSAVGSWHSNLRRSTAATDTVWAIVTTTYKVALVGLVLLLVMAVVGSAVRKRHQT